MLLTQVPRSWAAANSMNRKLHLPGHSELRINGMAENCRAADARGSDLPNPRARPDERRSARRAHVAAREYVISCDGRSGYLCVGRDEWRAQAVLVDLDRREPGSGYDSRDVALA